MKQILGKDVKAGQVILVGENVAYTIKSVTYTHLGVLISCEHLFYLLFIENHNIVTVLNASEENG